MKNYKRNLLKSKYLILYCYCILISPTEIGLIKNLQAKDKYNVLVKEENVNMYLVPNNKGKIIEKLTKNELISILEERKKWYRIQTADSVIGWVEKASVVINKNNDKIEERNNKVIKEKILLNKNEQFLQEARDAIDLARKYYASESDLSESKSLLRLAEQEYTNKSYPNVELYAGVYPFDCRSKLVLC